MIFHHDLYYIPVELPSELHPRYLLLSYIAYSYIQCTNVIDLHVSMM